MPASFNSSDIDHDATGTAAGEGTRDGVPLYAQQAVDWNTVKETPAPAQKIGGGTVVADVQPEAPRTIQVRSPQNYTPATRAHEAEHIVQNAIGDADHGLNAEGATSAGVYGYGGYDGLLKMQQQGQGVNTLSKEQQGALVGNYVRDARTLEAKARSGTLTHADTAQYDKIKQATHPMIRQLATPANAPIDTHPEAPGLPGAEVMGYMVPDKQMGGQWVPIHKAGNGQPLSKADATQYLQRAGGNKQLARAFALHDNHQF